MAVGQSLEALDAVVAAALKGTADGDDEDDDVTPSFTVSFHPTEGLVLNKLPPALMLSRRWKLSISLRRPPEVAKSTGAAQKQ